MASKPRKKGKGKGKKKKKPKRPLIATKIEPASMLEEMIAANNLYNKEWRLRNETDNPEQKHEDAMIIKEKRIIVGQEVRNEVDKLMRTELDRLKSALEGKKKKKKGKKKKGKKRSKGRKGRRGKGKKKKKKKKKKGKDLTPGKSLESLFQELVRNGIIKQVPPVRFNDLIGNPSLVNETIRNYYMEHRGVGENMAEEILASPATQEKMPMDPNPLPTFGDIKRAIKDICVLPMGSETVHKFAPYTKSVLLAGPKGSGKKSLVYAVCNELRATLFDLSPRNLVGKYGGKQGLAMLFHLLDKVGDWCQPVIIMIDQAEMAYMKRVPKDEGVEPKRIKKKLTKFIKQIGPDDRFMVFGLSTTPWSGKLKPMKKVFQRFIYIPKPDHQDRLEMWRNQLNPHHKEFNATMSMELDVLTKLSDCWTLGSIKECIEKALRKHYEHIDKMESELEGQQQQQKSLDFDPKAYLEGTSNLNQPKVEQKRLVMNDFLEQLMLIDPIFLNQDKSWSKWYTKTPLVKARLTWLGAPTGKKKKKKKGGQKGKGRK